MADDERDTQEMDALSPDRVSTQEAKAINQEDLAIAELNANPDSPHKLGKHSKESPFHSNEDSTVVKIENGRVKYVIVADGMGGHSEGSLASKTATGSMEQNLAGNKPVSAEAASDMIESAMQLASMDISEKNKGKDRKSRMGTTASVCYIHQEQDGTETAIIGNVGDSRVYLERNGKLIQISQDHDLTNAITELSIDGAAGAIVLPEELKSDEHIPQINEALETVWDSLTYHTNSEGREIPDLPPNGEHQFKVTDNTGRIHMVSVPNSTLIANFNNRFGLTHYIGQEKTPKPKMYTQKLLPGDRLLIASDGITDNLSPAKIAEILSDPNLSAEEKSRRLVLESVNAGKKPDDTTGIVIEVSDKKKAAKPEQIDTTQTEQKPLRNGDLVLFTLDGSQTKGMVMKTFFKLEDDGTSVEYAKVMTEDKNPSPTGKAIMRTVEVPLSSLRGDKQ